MPTTFQISFEDRNTGGSDDEGFRVYRRQDEDPCPGGQPNNARLVYTGHGESVGAGAVDWTDTTFTPNAGEDWYYRVSFYRNGGSDPGTGVASTEKVGSLLGPVRAVDENALGYPEHTPSHTSGVSHTVSVAPLYHFSADNILNQLEGLSGTDNFISANDTIQSINASYGGRRSFTGQAALTSSLYIDGTSMKGPGHDMPALPLLRGASGGASLAPISGFNIGYESPTTVAPSGTNPQHTTLHFDLGYTIIMLMAGVDTTRDGGTANCLMNPIAHTVEDGTTDVYGHAESNGVLASFSNNRPILRWSNKTYYDRSVRGDPFDQAGWIGPDGHTKIEYMKTPCPPDWCVDVGHNQTAHHKLYRSDAYFGTSVWNNSIPTGSSNWGHGSGLNLVIWRTSPNPVDDGLTGSFKMWADAKGQQPFADIDAPGNWPHYHRPIYMYNQTFGISKGIRLAEYMFFPEALGAADIGAITNFFNEKYAGYLGTSDTYTFPTFTGT